MEIAPLFFANVHCVSLDSSEREAKVAALPFDPRAFYPDMPAHSLYQLLADVEAQARTSHGAVHVAFQAHKAFEEVLLLIRRHTQTMITDADDDLPILHLTGNGHWGPLRRVFACIADQVEQHLAQADIIGH